MPSGTKELIRLGEYPATEKTAKSPFYQHEEYHFITQSSVLLTLRPPVMLFDGYLATPRTDSLLPAIDCCDLKMVIPLLLPQDPELWQS
jgi:hypothetical protein